ncbi:MAG: DUF4065 domain-containing protein [Candidatus Pacebacteria bacterium]|nr:DUF4065 domain-containing protein [Candidatus Paceibacterota bacterium]
MIKNLYKRIKSLREQKGLSQEFMAGKLGLSRPTYIQIEKGEREINLSEVQKIGDLFKLSFEELISGQDPASSRVELKKAKKTKAQKPEVRISVPQEKVEKFKETLLYILERIGARPNIGEAVVCKLMYFIDFDYYEKFEEQLIGAKYIKNHFGPTPVAFPEIVAQMEQDGELVRVTKKYFQHDQKKYLPLRSAELSKFSAQEKELIDWEIERFKDFNATKMRDYSHKDVPWIGTEDLQPINYEAVFSRVDEFSVRKYDEN